MIEIERLVSFFGTAVVALKRLRQAKARCNEIGVAYGGKNNGTHMERNEKIRRCF